MKNKDTFCVIPFTRIYTTNNGFWQHCCFGPVLMKNKEDEYFSMQQHSLDKVWNSEYMKELRSDLINGVKNSKCDYCWEREKQGAYSHRLKSNNDIRFNESLIPAVIADHGFLKEMPEGINIKLGNLCNLKCIMCNPVGSSMHEDEMKDWKTIKVQLPSWIDTIDKFEPENLKLKDFKGLGSENINFDQVIKNIEPMLPYCKEITLLGGEPFVHPMTEKILQLCIDKEIAKNITIEIITNLSILNKKHIDFFSKFKKAIIVVSYDHVNTEKFKYIRFPAPYEKFHNNFKILLESNAVTKKISTTFSIFNIFDFEEIFNEFEVVSNQLNRPLQININLVSTPEYFDIKYLEIDQKLELASRIETFLEKYKDYKIFKENHSLYQYLKTIKEFSVVDENKFKQVVTERTRVLELYDVTRKTDYRTLFPFIKEYY